MKDGIRGIFALVLVIVLSACFASKPPDGIIAPVTLVSSTATDAYYPSPFPSTPTRRPLGSVESPIILLGDFRVDDNGAREKWEAWAQRLSATTDLSIIVQPEPTSLDSLENESQRLEGLKAGRIHFTRLSSLAFWIGRKMGSVEPGPILEIDGQLARPVMFIARTDTGLIPGQSSAVLQQLAGRVPCYQVSPPEVYTENLSGYVVPAGLLALNRIRTSAPMILTMEHQQDYFLPQVAPAVFHRVCDFGTSEVTTPEGFKSLVPYDLTGEVSFVQWAKAMQVLYTSPPLIPNSTVAFSPSVPAPLRDKISRALIETTSVQLAQSDQYRPFEQAEPLYQELDRIVTASAVDIQAFLNQLAQTAQATPRPTPASIEWVKPPAETLVLDVPLGAASAFPPYSENTGEGLKGLMLPAIYAELVRMDSRGQYFSYLAASLPTIKNGLARFVGQGEDEQLEVEFRLRPGLRWQDNQPLTSDDLVFSWDLVLSPDWPGSHLGSSGLAPEVYLDSVQAPAPDRIIYRFMSQRQARQAARTGGKSGQPAWYGDLVQQVGPVVPLDYLEVGRNVFPRHLLKDIGVKDIGTSDWAREPIYAGAYRLAEGGVNGRPIVLEAFDNFSLGKPHIKRIVLGAGYYSKGITSAWQPPERLVTALNVGALQGQLGVTWVRSREGEDPRGYDKSIAPNLADVSWIPRTTWEVLDFNLDNPHLSDLRVRQAIAYAIDRQAIIDQVHGGHAELMKSYLPAWHPLYAGDVALPAYKYDLEQARTLLREAGYDLSQTPAVHQTRGPLVLHLDTMDVAPFTRPPAAELIKKQLAQVGMQVEVRFHAWPDFEGKDCSAIRNGRQFDLGMAGYLTNTSVRFPITLLQETMASQNIPTRENDCAQGNSNWPGWHNAQADAILSQLKDGRLALEQPEHYKQLWAEHQELWAKDLPTLPLFNVDRPVTVAKQLVGVQASPFAFGGGVEDTWNIWEWRLK